jgi:hypothetical protein
MLRRDHLGWQYLPTTFYENPQIVSKVISEGHTDRDTNTHTHTHTHRQAGDLISPLSFFESRLKINVQNNLAIGAGLGKRAYTAPKMKYYNYRLNLSAV